MHGSSDEFKRDEHGEFEFLELLSRIWKHRLVLLVFFSLVMALTLALVFLMKPVYQASSYVLPPDQNGISNFNFGRSKDTGLDPYSVRDVYDVFLRKLQSEAVRREYYFTVVSPEPANPSESHASESGYLQFDERLLVGPVNREAPDLYSISVQGGNSKNVAKWASGFVEFAAQKSVDELIGNIKKEANVRSRSIAEQIEVVQSNGRLMREDAVKRLSESLKVAKAMGLEQPLLSNGRTVDFAGSDRDGSTAYMRGSKALQAEINALQERDSDDAFIDRLRDLQMRKEIYDRLDVKPDEVSVFRFDGPTQEPSSPIKPRKLLMILAGILVGIIGGTVLALASSIVEQYRRKTGRQVAQARH